MNLSPRWRHNWRNTDMKQFKQKYQDALAEIDKQLGNLADLSYVDEIWRIRALIDKEFPSETDPPLR